MEETVANSIPFELPNFEVEQVRDTGTALVIQANSKTKEACCPECGQCSKRIHSYYVRIPQDLPSSGKRINLHLRVKRFRCTNEACVRATFVERIPDFLSLHAQRTNRVKSVLRQLAFAVGGEGGARITQVLQMPCSPNTLLRAIRHTSLAAFPPPQVVGVDDWAMRKGHNYGTILVDLERHHPIDLLPDREAQTLADWLKDHPQIEVVSRDRSGVYAKGIQQGAPQATQVADRWHLLKNLREALAESYDSHYQLLKQVSVEREPVLTSEQSTSPDPVRKQPPSHQVKRPPTAEETARQQRREYWLGKFQQVHELRAQGMGIQAIAHQLELSRTTVRKYSRLSELPKKTSPKPGPRLIDPYRAYIRQRLKEENPSITAIWKEIQLQGFTGGHTTVYKCVAQLRHEMGIPPLKQPPRKYPPPKSPALTGRQLAAFVLSPPDKLSVSQQNAIVQACSLHVDIQQATQQASDFASMLRKPDASQLDAWLQSVINQGSPSLRKFASGIQNDYAAVRAAFTLPWSNGQVEGQVNRLKLIKRQMYGRARFDLLRLRVLFPS